jgi:hypothetical protein
VRNFKTLSMYIISYLITLTILLFGCGNLNSNKVSEKVKSQATDTVTLVKSSYNDTSFFNRIYFSKSDAEKILGEKAYLSDSSSTIKKDTLEIKTAYTANSKDKITGKTGVIYFMIEEYIHDSSAKNAYHFIKVANENHEGVKIINDMGDEAYFHSDGQNFYFILVRKGKIMFRAKVNKITSHTSLKEFNRISKKISDDLWMFAK